MKIVLASLETALSVSLTTHVPNQSVVQLKIALNVKSVIVTTLANPRSVATVKNAKGMNVSLPVANVRCVLEKLARIFVDLVRCVIVMENVFQFVKTVKSVSMINVFQPVATVMIA